MDMDNTDYYVDLNGMEATGVIDCPYCSKGKMYMYNSKGKASLNCGRCNKIVLWDFDKGIGFKAKPRKHAS